MSDFTDIEALAADYVLGQLPSAERAQVAARMVQDRALAEAVGAWERRLAPLIETAPAIQPPAGIYPAIEMRLGLADAANDNLAMLSRRVRFWRGATLAAGALAACLALFVVAGEGLRPAKPETLVAVLQKDAASPAFLMTVNVSTKTFTVRAVDPAPLADKSYELWIIDASFPHPQSLGVVGDRPFDTGAALDRFDPAIVRKATYAVTLEPKGGSASGLPTGPVVYAGKLVQATP
jgi:anti-sigma-K factor RskA